MARPLRVFHCDDSPPFCELVRFWLDEHSDLEHVGAAHDLPSALPALRAALPDVVLLDTLVEPGETDTVVADVLGAAPRARIVLYSGYPREILEPALLGAGGDVVFVRKDDDEAHLVATLRALA